MCYAALISYASPLVQLLKKVNLFILNRSAVRKKAKVLTGKTV